MEIVFVYPSMLPRYLESEKRRTRKIVDNVVCVCNVVFTNMNTRIPVKAESPGLVEKELNTVE